MTQKHERQKEIKAQKALADMKEPKPDSQNQNVNHNTKKVSLGPNTKR